MGLGFETDRLKTGTPSRVDARTIDYSRLEAQPGDPDTRWFSFDPEVKRFCQHSAASCLAALPLCRAHNRGLQPLLARLSRRRLKCSAAAACAVLLQASVAAKGS